MAIAKKILWLKVARTNNSPDLIGVTLFTNCWKIRRLPSEINN